MDILWDASESHPYLVDDAAARRQVTGSFQFVNSALLFSSDVVNVRATRPAAHTNPCSDHPRRAASSSPVARQPRG